ncbi:hypothetical protein ON010_g11852 [Phytophthora cinnamomi]|nr:hypothetical protein ON010_g11852 [Phytophthora cinnamomi]
MRGAALKLGQMLSIQDEAMIPSKLAVALDRVRENAHVMPKDQLHHQLETELGEDWRSKFQEFDDVPIAAASIGQVHRATLLNGERVAIKIQYPGVAESIGSDLSNLKRLVTYTNILPRGLYIDEIIRVGKEELTAECDYLTEAENQERFRELIEQSGMGEKYVVPRVYRELSTSRILTTQLISGVAVDKAVHLSQDVRNSIARRILELTIHELFNWRFMQTDPNWSNFMYNASTDTIGLVDFGALASIQSHEKTLVDYSIKMHFLTGDESPAMMRAHVAAGMVVGEPFRSHEPFDFQKSKLTTRLGQHTEVFMHGRLTPPPQEVYSLHRKLAGAFLMCIKLRAVVPCRDVLENVQQLRAQEAERQSYRDSIRRWIGNDASQANRTDGDSPTPSLDEKAPAQEDPFERFKKMLKFGIPRVAVEDRMRKDGINPAGLNGPVPKGQVYMKSTPKPAPSAPRTPHISRKRWHWAQVPDEKRAPLLLLEVSAWTQRTEKGATRRISDAIKSDLLMHYTSMVNLGSSNAACVSAGRHANLTSAAQKRSRTVTRGCVRMMKGRKGLTFELAVRRIKTPFAKVAEDLNDLTAVYLKNADLKTILAMWPSMTEQLVLNELLEENAGLGIANGTTCDEGSEPAPFEQQIPENDVGAAGLRQFRQRTRCRDDVLSKLFAGVAAFAYDNEIVHRANENAQDYGDTTDEDNYLLEFYEEINQVLLSSRVSVSAMKAEMKQLREGHRLATSLAEAALSTSASREAAESAARSRTAFARFADEVDSELGAGQELLDKMEISKQRFRCKYEENQDSPLEQNFSTIARFVSEFKARATTVQRPVSRM